MDKRLVVIVLILLLLSCGNKSRETQSIINDNRPVVEQEKPNSVSTSIQAKAPKVEKEPSTPVGSSSSRSHKSYKYDNMRGFDPASEDDMDDNGISRYMENNDDEGWD